MLIAVSELTDDILSSCCEVCILNAERKEWKFDNALEILKKRERSVTQKKRLFQTHVHVNFFLLF